MKKVLFIDRDGTIIEEPEDEQVDSLDKLKFLPGVITALSGIMRETDFELVMVTNQDGLGTSSFPEENFWPVQNKMLQILEGEGVKFAEIFIDRSLPGDNAPTRKPGTAMLTRYLAGGVDLDSSFVIGDRSSDLMMAKNLECNAIYLSPERHPDAIFSTTDWKEIYHFLKKIPRKAVAVRNTRETSVAVEVNLDGTGKSIIDTGIGFFDHMLGQIARHGSIDLNIKATGDLNVDLHHTIEDVAIVLGESLSRALGTKKGIGRYGFLLPMDESLAQVVIDLSGRPWIVWNVDFPCGNVGEIPSEMFFHFFKSFSDTAGCTINITATGENAHHKVEAVFKAFAKSLKMAVSKTDDFNLPSTKGIL
jgi:imidazoleglycerol-phosphate dehydratase/histidinol-phosphatase